MIMGECHFMVKHVPLPHESPVYAACTLMNCASPFFPGSFLISNNANCLEFGILWCSKSGMLRCALTLAHRIAQRHLEACFFIFSWNFPVCKIMGAGDWGDIDAVFFLVCP